MGELPTAYRKRGFSCRDLLPDFLRGASVRLGRHRHDGPHEPTELAGHGDDDFVRVLSHAESVELLGESVLRLHGDRDDVRRLPLSSPVQDQVRASSMSMIPAGFHQDSSDVSVAGLRDWPASFDVSGGAFLGNESDPRHE